MENFQNLGLQINFTVVERALFHLKVSELETLFGGRTYEDIRARGEIEALKKIRLKLDEIIAYVKSCQAEHELKSRLVPYKDLEKGQYYRYQEDIVRFLGVERDERDIFCYKFQQAYDSKRKDSINRAGDPFFLFENDEFGNPVYRLTLDERQALAPATTFISVLRQNKLALKRRLQDDEKYFFNSTGRHLMPTIGRRYLFLGQPVVFEDISEAVNGDQRFLVTYLDEAGKLTDRKEWFHLGDLQYFTKI